MRRLAVVGSGIAALLSTSTALAAETVAIVTATPEADEAARYLSTQVDHPVVRRTSPNARNLEALVREARAHWPEDLVVVVDTARAAVSVVRPADGTMGSRALSPSAATAPYAVALAAVELLEIVESAPPARAAALPSTATSGPTTRVAIGLGIRQSVGTNGEVGLLQPTAGVDMELSAYRSPAWFGIGFHVTGLSSMHRAQALAVPAGTDPRGSIDYARTEFSLRPAIGHRQGPAAALGFLDIGLASVETTAKGAEGQTYAVDSRLAFWLGLSGELRYTIGGGFALGLGAGAALLPVTSRFYPSARGDSAAVPAFVESPVELRAAARVIWESP